MEHQLFTVGHSNRTFGEFVAILNAHDIEFLADIRGGRATSRTFPHFDSVSMATTIPAAGIKYKRIEVLGGRRGRSLSVDPSVNGEWRLPAFHNYADYAYNSSEFDQGIRELLNLSKRYRVAYMCSEAVPWRCHRSIVTDYLLLVYDAKVTHLLGEKQTMVGAPHDFAKKEGTKVVYPSKQDTLFQ